MPVPAQLEEEGGRVGLSVLTGFLATSSQGGPQCELTKIQPLSGGSVTGDSFSGWVALPGSQAIGHRAGASPPFWAVATPELPKHKLLDVCPFLERRATRGAPREQSSGLRQQVQKVGGVEPLPSEGSCTP